VENIYVIILVHTNQYVPVSTIIIGSVIDCLSKVEEDSKLCVYHPINVPLPTRGAGFWIVHDELESLQKQAIIDLGKFLKNSNLSVCRNICTLIPQL
jgi:hypothetical protein